MGKRMRIFITGLPVISLGGWVSFSEGGRTAPGTYLITMDARGAYRGQWRATNGDNPACELQPAKGVML